MSSKLIWYVTDIRIIRSFILKCPAFSTPPLTGAIPFFRFGCRLVAWKWLKHVETLETILSRHVRLVGRNSIELAIGGRGDLPKTNTATIACLGVWVERLIACARLMASFKPSLPRFLEKQSGQIGHVTITVGRDGIKKTCNFTC